MPEQAGTGGYNPALKQSAMDDISESVDSSAIMMVIYSIMVMSIIAIPFLYFAIYSAFIRFLLAFIALLILMLFLSARTVEKIPAGHTRKRREDLVEVKKPGIAAMKKTVERAFAGYQSSQILIRDTLRDVLVRRIAMKKRMDIWEVEEMCTKGDVSGLVSDPELQNLLKERHVRPKGAERGVLKKLRKKRGDNTEDYRRWLEEIIRRIDEI